VRVAFTVVELLVVIFIIAILSVLILAGVSRAQRSSRISRTRADLAAISTAIEQYHSDFRDYPLPTPPAGPGFRTILAQALVGPGPKEEDGADGPGFRTVINPATGTFDPNSKKWDAYLSGEHFKPQKFARGWAFVDYFGNPIRYYPKRKSLNTKQPNTLVDAVGNCIFDARDGEHPQTGALELSAESLQVIVGDLNNSNSIDGDESLSLEGNFILATPGADGIFTVYVKGESQAVRRQKSTKSDDIFNFER